MMRPFCLAVGLTVLLSVGANATLISWSPTPTTTDVTGGAVLPLGTDPGEGNSLGGTYLSGTDITGVWWQRTGGYDYFRMDLAGTPTESPLNFANQYAILIDSGSGGASGADSYTPDMLTGIDYVLDMHFSTGSNNWDVRHFHTWDGVSAWITTTPFTVGNQGIDWDITNGGKTLEWRIPDTYLGSSFTFWGATHDTNYDNHTYDITDSGTTPEPCSTALFFSGIAFLWLRRRA
jgi:hypothetical protein